MEKDAHPDRKAVKGTEKDAQRQVKDESGVGKAASPRAAAVAARCLIRKTVPFIATPAPGEFFSFFPGAMSGFHEIFRKKTSGK